MRDPAPAFELVYEGKSSLAEILATPFGIYMARRPLVEAWNRLYHADNLGVLASLLAEPDIAGKVALVYIDPPFATGSTFELAEGGPAFHDHLIGPAYIESLRRRLALIHALLSDEGSLYLHLDERMMFVAKLVLDEIFGASNFRRVITRRKSNPKNYTRKSYGNTSDYLLFYSKSDRYTWNRPMVPWDDESAAKEYRYVDEDGRRFKTVPVHAPGARNGATGQAWKGKTPPPGKHWQYAPATLEQMDSRGEIYWSANGNPRRKLYLDMSNGRPVQDIWADVPDAVNQNQYVTGYPTEKNPAMLRRIIEASSSENDIVLDCYCGSGTTLEQASLLNRRWIGVDEMHTAIETTLHRLEVGPHRMGDYNGTTHRTSPSCHKPVRDFNLYREVVETTHA